MLENISRCPICKGEKFDRFLTCKDHSVSKENFEVIECNQCKFKFTNPRPSKENIGSYYESSNYISHSNKNNSLINIVYKSVRKVTVKQKAKLVTKLNSPAKILDYGCGTGEFLKACQLKGWDVSGIEPSALARKQATILINKNITGSIFDKDYNTKFQIITLWHVLEHIQELNKTLEKLTQLLDQNGFMIIAVPNHLSFDAQHYKQYWAGYDIPRHLYHFDQQSIRNLINQYGLKVIREIPQKLDAYYVSMLSEKYKNKKNNYLNAIINGFKSNKFAKKNKNKYSSIIYIVQHV